MKIPQCQYHLKNMSIREGKFGQFWSCGEKLADGTYCKYKPNKDEYPIGEEGKFTSNLDIDLKDQKWDKINADKNENISWMNAKNGAVMLIANHPAFKEAKSDQLRELMYKLAVKIFEMEMPEKDPLGLGEYDTEI